MDFFNDIFHTIQNFLATQTWPNSNDLSRLIKWPYWIEGPLDSFSPFYLAGSVAVLACLALLIFWRIRLKKAQKLTPVYDVPINHILNIISIIILMSASYFFFRSQQIAYLSSRLLVLATFAVCLIWLGYLIYFIKRSIPSKRRHYLERERFFRYLPNIPKERNK